MGGSGKITIIIAVKDAGTNSLADAKRLRRKIRFFSPRFLDVLMETSRTFKRPIVFELFGRIRCKFNNANWTKSGNYVTNFIAPCHFVL